MTRDQWLWVLFAATVIPALAFDLGLKSHRQRTQAVTLAEALRWTALWAGLAIAFSGVVRFFLNGTRAVEFLTAYIVEESLSVDNMFIFVVIFDFFRIPTTAQPRVLKWGIFGAILFRFVLIFTGVALLKRFHWILYVFGALLIVTAFKLLGQSDESVRPGENWLLRLFKRFSPVTSELHGAHFFVVQEGRRLATPLFTTLLVIEASDVMFAMDSIPAVLAISDHPFIIFSSNVFAVLGLRALFFVVSGFMASFAYLRYGLAAILVFIGAKMLLSSILHIPPVLSLGIVASCLAVSMLASVVVKKAG